MPPTHIAYLKRPHVLEKGLETRLQQGAPIQTPLGVRNGYAFQKDLLLRKVLSLCWNVDLCVYTSTPPYRVRHLFADCFLSLEWHPRIGAP